MQQMALAVLDAERSDQRQWGVICFSMIQNKQEVGKLLGLQKKWISESHFTPGFYVCSRKGGLDDVLLFSSFEYIDSLNNCCYLKGRMFCVCSWEAAEELIKSFFTALLLISDTSKKYQEVISEVIFSLVFNVNSKIMGLGCREVGWQTKSLQRLVVWWLGKHCSQASIEGVQIYS